MKDMLVSIGVPLYNNQRFIGKALESIINQDYKNIEIIICDDASSDNSGDICEKYSKKDKRIKYIRNKFNLGGIRNHNLLFELSSGEYFMWGSDHDMWDESYVSKCLNILEKERDTILCYSRTIMIDMDDKPLHLTPDILDTRGLDLLGRFKKILWELDWGNMFLGLWRSGCLAKTQLNKKCLGHDLVLLAEASLHGAVAQIMEPLYYRRQNRPPEKNEETLKRWVKDVIAIEGLEAKLPWLGMANEYINVIKRSDLSTQEKEQFYREVIECTIARRGSLIKEEINSCSQYGVNLLNEIENYKYTRHIYERDLINILNTARDYGYTGFEVLTKKCLSDLGILEEVQKEDKQIYLQSPPEKLTWDYAGKLEKIKLYAGDIPLLPQYEGLIGLSLTQNDVRHLKHDITLPVPLPDNSVDSFQAEDVFEHIEYEKLTDVIDEIYRILKPGGLFRLSVPDYGCDILRERSIKNDKGEIIFDPDGGGTAENPGHVWFPRIKNVKKLLNKSEFARDGKIEYLHYYNMNGTFVAEEIDYSKGYVHRTPEHDTRVKNPYRPMSLVVDLTAEKKKFIKTGQKVSDMLSPLTGNSNIRLEKEILCKEIINLYKRDYNIDVTGYFKRLDKIRIYRCLDSDLRFYYPFGLEGDSKFYEALQGFEWYYMDWKWEHEIVKKLLKPEDKILEIGCAKGAFIEYLTESGVECCGLELNEDAVRTGRKKGIKILRESIKDHARNNPGQYDIVCSFQVAEHVAMIRDFITDSLYAVKNGGKLIISVPNHDSFIGLDEWNALDMPPHHMGLWNEKSLRNLPSIFNITLKEIYIEPLQSYHNDYYLNIMKNKITNKFNLHTTMSQFVHKSGEKFKGHTVLAEYIKRS